jgi:small-conductance mechanosensitive channel
VSRYATTLAIAALVAGLWLLYGFSEDYRILGGVSTTNVVLWAAWLATVLLLVIVVGRLVLGFGFALYDHEATGLQRGIVYSVLTFIVVSVLLGSLGVNIAAILTTSVVTTAIVGLAMQPTLGGVIAGSTLQLGRVLRIGDVILLDDEPIEVLSLNWRSIVGLKNGSTVVIIPNARVADTRLDILRADQPVRVDVVVPAPLTVSPHRINEILSEATYDLPYADPGLPVRVEPLAYRNLDGLTNYRVEYWTAHSRDIYRARQALLARLWYIYQREQIAWPVPAYLGTAPASVNIPTDRLKGLGLDRVAEAKLTGLGFVELAGDLAPEVSTRRITDCGRPLCYGDGELIVIPRGLEEFALFLLVDGDVREAPLHATHGDSSLQTATLLTNRSDRMMAIERIADELALRIGPYAEYAVREAAAADPDPIAVSVTVAQEIDDPAERARFLGGLRMDYDELRKPGYVFGLQRGALARVSSPPVRAVGGAVVLPITLEP